MATKKTAKAAAFEPTFKKLKSGRMAAFVKSNESSMIQMYTKQFDPATGLPVEDAIDYIEIRHLKKQRDAHAAEVARLDEQIEAAEKAEADPNEAAEE